MLNQVLVCIDRCREPKWAVDTVTRCRVFAVIDAAFVALVAQSSG